MILGRRAFLGGLMLLPTAVSAAPLAKMRETGQLNVALYRDFEPWSWRRDGKLVGIDVEFGQLIAKELGVPFEPVEFIADEDVGDDLRNIIWRGSVAGGGVADLMMHVPFDREFAKQNDRALFLAPYCHESFAFAADRRVVDADGDYAGFKDHKIAVEADSVPDTFLLGSLGQRRRDTIIHKATGSEAVAAMVAGDVPLVMATRAQIEHGLTGKEAGFGVRKGSIPGLFSTGWDVGVAVRDDSRDLGDAVATIIAAAIADKRVDAIFARYGVRREAPRTA